MDVQMTAHLNLCEVSSLQKLTSRKLRLNVIVVRLDQQKKADREFNGDLEKE